MTTDIKTGGSGLLPLDAMGDRALLEAHAARCAALLRSLANPHRLMVLCHLMDGERSVGALLERMDVTPSNLSQHLARLREAGLVATRRDGTTVYYRLVDERSRAFVIDLYQRFGADQPFG